MRSVLREARSKSAILDADVVGPSRPAVNREPGWTLRLVQDRVERLQPAVARHGGRVLRLTSTGARAEFPSAAAALGAAIEFQQAMADANLGQSKDNAVVFRLGLHLGQTQERSWQEAHGKARAGAIVISAPLHDAVAGHVKASFAELGQSGLGTVDEPVHAYEVGWDPADWPSESASAALPVSARGDSQRFGRWAAAVAWTLLVVTVGCFAIMPRPLPKAVTPPGAEVETLDHRLRERQAEAAVARWHQGRGEPDEADDEPANPDTLPPADSYDGVYAGTATMRPDSHTITFRLKVLNGVGSGTQSRLDCGTAPIALRISPAGDVSGMMLIFSATCLKTELAVRGRAVGGLLQLRLGSQYVELDKAAD
jgi:class 3 adenylate cyclase